MKAAVHDDQRENQLKRIPVEILHRILSHLDLDDIVNLCQTSKKLNEDITKSFELRRVHLLQTDYHFSILTSRCQESVKKNRKQILSFAFNGNIGLWEYTNWLKTDGLRTPYIDMEIDDEDENSHGKGTFEKHLKKLKLKYVKDVKFIGPNYGGHEYALLLTQQYKSTLRNVFLSKKFIRKLEISADSTQECYEYLGLLKNMKFLKELILRSRSFDRPAGVGYNLSQLLANTLNGLNIQSLCLKNNGVNHQSRIEMESPYIEVLQIENDKHTKLGCFKLPNLREMNYDGVWASCLLHEHFNDSESITGMLSKNCPKLEYYNGMDLNKLRMESPTGEWIDVLENHPGEGQTKSPCMNDICCMCYRTPSPTHQLQSAEDTLQGGEEDGDWEQPGPSQPQPVHHQQERDKVEENTRGLIEFARTGKRLRATVKNWCGRYGFLRLHCYFKLENIFIHMSDVIGPKPLNGIMPGTVMEVGLKELVGKYKVKAIEATILY